LQKGKLAEAGLERTSKTSGKTHFSEPGGAKCGALDARDTDLAEVVAGWPKLSEETRSAVLELIRHTA